MPQKDNMNKYSLWALLTGAATKEKSRALTPAEQDRIILRWQIISFIGFLCIFLWFFEIIFGSTSGGIITEGSMNPIKIFFAGLKTEPLKVLFITALAYGISVIVARVKRAGLDEPQIIVDDQGEKIIADSTAGVRAVLTTDEERKIFTLSDLSTPFAGVPIAINQKTGEVIMKVPGLRNDYTWHLQNDNILVVGPSGAGKTSGILKSAQATHMLMHHGCLIFDPKGELYPALMPLEIELKRRTWLLNFKDGELTHSDGIDLLKPIREADIDLAIQLTDKYTEKILDDAGEQYWSDSAKNLFRLLVLYVTRAKTYVPPKVRFSSDDSMVAPSALTGGRTWRELMKLVSTSSDQLVDILAAAVEDEEDGELLADYFTTWAEDKNYSQIRSSLANSLTVFKSPAVLDILSTDEIDIDALAEGDASIYVASSGRNDTYTPVLTLFVDLVMDRTMAIAEHNGGALDDMLFIMLEEFNNLGRLDSLPKILSQNRSYNISILISIQTMNQLDKYNTDKEAAGRSSIQSACALQLCVGANEGVGSDVNGDTATYFSARAGNKERVDVQITEDRFKPLPEEIQAPLQWDQKQRTTNKVQLVFPPDRIQALTSNEIFISPGPHRCVIERKYQWDYHPFAGTYAVDRETGERASFLTTEHTPIMRGGRPCTCQEYKAVVPGKPKKPEEGIISMDTRSYEDFLVD